MSTEEKTISEDQHNGQQLSRSHPFVGTLKVPIAKSAEEVESNYPFSGMLHRFNEELGTYQFVKLIEKPIKLSDFQRSPSNQGGEYKIITDVNGEQIEFEFKVAEPEIKATEKASQLREDEISKIKMDTRALVSQEFESRMNGYKDDIEQYSRKYRDLLAENAALSTKEFQARQALIEKHHAREMELMTQISDLKSELAIANLKADFNEDDKGFQSKLMDLVAEVAPDLLKNFAPQGAIENPAQLPEGEMEVTDLNDIEVHEEMQHTQQIDPAAVRAEFRKKLLQHAINALKKENPDIQAFQNQVFGMVNQLTQANVAIQSGDWIQSIKAISNFSLKNEVPSEKIASLLHPVVSHFTSGSKAVRIAFKSMPADGLVDMLLSQFNIEAPEPLQNLLVEVFTHLKTIEAN